MKVDYHIHLEEGPYSIGWLAKINESLQHYEPLKEGKTFYGMACKNTRTPAKTCE